MDHGFTQNSPGRLSCEVCEVGGESCGAISRLRVARLVLVEYFCICETCSIYFLALVMQYSHKSKQNLTALEEDNFQKLIRVGYARRGGKLLWTPLHAWTNIVYTHTSKWSNSKILLTRSFVSKRWSRWSGNRSLHEKITAHRYAHSVPFSVVIRLNPVSLSKLSRFSSTWRRCRRLASWSSISSSAIPDDKLAELMSIQ